MNADRLRDRSRTEALRAQLGDRLPAFLKRQPARCEAGVTLKLRDRAPQLVDLDRQAVKVGGHGPANESLKRGLSAVVHRARYEIAGTTR